MHHLSLTQLNQPQLRNLDGICAQILAKWAGCESGTTYLCVHVLWLSEANFDKWAQRGERGMDKAHEKLPGISAG